MKAKKEETKKVKKITKDTKKAPKKQSFWKGLKIELKKVKWPEKKEVIKYTLATIIFVVVFVLLFALLNLFMSYIKGLFA